MLARYVVRGLKAGAVAGLAFGLFVALVGNPLIGYAETFEHAHGHGGGPAVPGAVTAAVSVAGGVLMGVLLGAVVLGAAFYFLEPAIPGEGGTKSYLLGAAGFVTVSGAPWLVLPPQPPGVEQSLPVETRLQLYAAAMAAGALACGLSGHAYVRLRERYGRPAGVGGALVPLCLLLVTPAVAPANAVSGSVPVGFALVFRTVTGAGQVGLWFVLASAHAWLLRRGSEASAGERTALADATGSPVPDR